jgi:hypothetical protein
MTELAQSVADMEVRKRGLDTATNSVPAMTAVPETIDASRTLTRRRLPASKTVFGRITLWRRTRCSDVCGPKALPGTIVDVQTNNQLPVTVGGVRVQVRPSARRGPATSSKASGRGSSHFRDEDAQRLKKATRIWRTNQRFGTPMRGLAQLDRVYERIRRFGPRCELEAVGKIGSGGELHPVGARSAAVVHGGGIYTLQRATYRNGSLLVFVHLVNTIAWYFVSGRRQSMVSSHRAQNKYERRESGSRLYCFAVIVLACALAVLR